MMPPVVLGRPAPEQISLTDRAKIEMLKEPIREHCLTVSASAAAIVFNFELIAKRDHRLADCARSIVIFALDSFSEIRRSRSQF
jgi:hypothetical protein